MKIGWYKLFYLSLFVALQCLFSSSLIADRVNAQDIELSKTDLGFHVRSMNLSPNGKALVAWGGAKRSPAYSTTSSGPSLIAVVDTQTVKILGKKCDSVPGRSPCFVEAITEPIQTITDGRASLSWVILSMEKAVNGARMMIENTDK